MSDVSFIQRFISEVGRSLGNDYSDNYDVLRFGQVPPVAAAKKSFPREWVKRQLQRRNYQQVRQSAGIFQEAVNLVAPHLPGLERLTQMLGDEESRELLIKLMAFRALGHRKIKLPFKTPELWQGFHRAEELASNLDCLDAGLLGWKLNKLDLDLLGIPVTLYTTPAAAHITFLAQQYRGQCTSETIEACEGDYVIDGGGCWGDTALYFANKVGPMGRVFTFEFVGPNLEIMRRNLDLNPRLNKQIEIVQKALWSHSGETLSYAERGPGTSVSSDTGAELKTVRTLTIDDLVSQKQLPRVDFIKMDIEGAELAALRGAEQTLRRFKPRLAICVYHRVDDFFEIPDYLHSLGLNYRFVLRHFTIHAEETVLFARADRYC